MRRLLFLTIAILILSTAVPTAPASAATSLTYHAGYSVQSGWLCYGWPSGAYRCTQHWAVVNGRYVSYNPGWTPSQGSGGVVGLASEREPDGDADDTALVRTTTSGTVAGMIQAAFGGYAWQALNVARCESGLNPNAYNGVYGATGVFQFLYSTWLGTPYASYSRYNAWANIQAAHYVFVRDGYSWREWTCGYLLGYV